MKEIKVVAGVFTKNEKILIARRKEGKSMAGYWEFPGGKIEPGEVPEEALKRELLEELEIDVRVGAFITTHTHDYPDFRIQLTGYYVNTDAEITQSSDHDAFLWIVPENYADYTLAPADIPILQTILKGTN